MGTHEPNRLLAPSAPGCSQNLWGEFLLTPLLITYPVKNLEIAKLKPSNQSFLVRVCVHIRTVCKLGAFIWKEWSAAQGRGVAGGLKGEDEVAYPSVWLAVKWGFPNGWGWEEREDLISLLGRQFKLLL